MFGQLSVKNKVLDLTVKETDNSDQFGGIARKKTIIGGSTINKHLWLSYLK